MKATSLEQDRVDIGWIDDLPRLDDQQAGALRRFLNLSARLPDDWSGMLGPTTLQEDFGALRFQLAYMSYALALTHVHRLPAAAGLFRGPFDALIRKMLSPDVWMYWHYVSTGGGPFNKDLGELPSRWDPVETDNIMYSAYIQSMALLYHYLFRDDKYAAKGALTFSINPLFWALGGKHFAYDERSLNEHLYWMMVERGYLGIACEPNCVFQVCNQVPILGFRFHDLVYGGDTAGEVTTGYLKAWAEFGVLDEAGRYTMMVQERERAVITPQATPWTDFWLGALMHAWNPELVQRHYPMQMARWSVSGPEDTMWIKPAPPLGSGYSPIPSARDFGWGAVCASEVGDQDTLARLLAYADRFLQPAWEDGGLYYRRHDELTNADGLLSAMDPHTGNVLLHYARLNVPGGLARLYAGPLDDAHFAAPTIEEIGPAGDLRRAFFDRGRGALVVRLVGVPGTTVEIGIANALNRAPVEMACAGGNGQTWNDRDADLVRVAVTFQEKVVDLVLAWP